MEPPLGLQIHFAKEDHPWGVSWDYDAKIKSPKNKYALKWNQP